MIFYDTSPETLARIRAEIRDAVDLVIQSGNTPEARRWARVQESRELECKRRARSWRRRRRDGKWRLMGDN